MRTRRISLFAFVVLLLAPLPGAADASAQATPVAVTCAATPLAAEPTAFPLTITDDAGRQVTIERSPTRIVSIAPSNTEMLFALGLDERIAGVDSYSTYPPEAGAKTPGRQLPRARPGARRRRRAGSDSGDGSACGNSSAGARGAGTADRRDRAYEPGRGLLRHAAGRHDHRRVDASAARGLRAPGAGRRGDGCRRRCTAATGLLRAESRSLYRRSGLLCRRPDRPRRRSERGRGRGGNVAANERRSGRHCGSGGHSPGGS